MTDIEVTLRGYAYALVPGMTYVLEVDHDVPLDRLQQLREALETRTECKWVVLSRGLHVATARPAEDES